MTDFRPFRPMDVDAARSVADLLTSFTYHWATEVELQDAIADVLRTFADGPWPEWLRGGPTVQREAPLTARDRPDFLVDLFGQTVAVEVKVKGSRAAILRQVGRYAAHPAVDAVILAAGRRAIAAGFPHQVHGTPVIAVHLGSP